MTPATFIAVIEQLLPEPHAGLLSGILFGTKASLSRPLTDALITTGTLHIVALSGMNITILESIVAKSLGRVLSIRITSVLTIFIIIGFIIFVGPSASVIRAGIMGTLALGAIIFGRQRWTLFFFFLAAGAMLAVRPQWLFDMSFQLSMGATLGIILFGPTGNHSIIVESLYTTLAAQVFTIPIIFFVFQRISFVSPLTNVLIGWMIQPLTVFGLVLCLIGYLWLPLAQPVAWITWACLEYCIKIVEFTAVIPFASFK